MLLLNGINRDKVHGREMNGKDCQMLAGNKCEAVFSSMVRIVEGEGGYAKTKKTG